MASWGKISVLAVCWWTFAYCSTCRKDSLWSHQPHFHRSNTRTSSLQVSSLKWTKQTTESTCSHELWTERDGAILFFQHLPGGSCQTTLCWHCEDVSDVAVYRKWTESFKRKEEEEEEVVVVVVCVWGGLVTEYFQTSNEDAWEDTVFNLTL